MWSAPTAFSSLSLLLSSSSTASVIFRSWYEVPLCLWSLVIVVIRRHQRKKTKWMMPHWYVRRVATQCDQLPRCFRHPRHHQHYSPPVISFVPWSFLHLSRCSLVILIIILDFTFVVVMVAMDRCCSNFRFFDTNCWNKREGSEGTVCHERTASAASPLYDLLRIDNSK